MRSGIAYRSVFNQNKRRGLPSVCPLACFFLLRSLCLVALTRVEDYKFILQLLLSRRICLIYSCVYSAGKNERTTTDFMDCFINFITCTVYTLFMNALHTNILYMNIILCRGVRSGKEHKQTNKWQQQLLTPFVMSLLYPAHDKTQSS